MRPSSTPDAAHLATVGCKRDELRDVARAASLDAVELTEQLRDRGRALRCVARRVEPRAAVERLDLDARVLADRPASRRADARPKPAFAERVLVVRLAGLVGPALGVERLDRPAGEQRARARAPCGRCATRGPLSVLPPHLEYAVDVRDARDDERRRGFVQLHVEDDAATIALLRRPPSRHDGRRVAR